LVPVSVGASHPVPASCWRKVAYALSDWCAWSQIPSHSSQSGATSAFTRAMYSLLLNLQEASATSSRLVQQRCSSAPLSKPTVTRSSSQSAGLV
jgi:hypothetical protein